MITTLRTTEPRTTRTKNDQDVFRLILRNKLGLRSLSVQVSKLHFYLVGPTLVVIIQAANFFLSSRRVTRRARSYFLFRDYFCFTLDEEKQKAASSRGTQQSVLGRVFPRIGMCCRRIRAINYN